MKNTIPSVIILVTLLGICSCASTGGAREKPDDWPGVYAGVIPSAGGSGFSVVAIFKADRTYKISYHYIDREDKLYVDTGTFEYNDAARLITLNNSELPPYYKVEKQSLLQLDIEGNVITGKFAGSYRLKKV